ncbi:uncharacterized protein LOC129741012 [Uranotaenia lowii]|uniref:uncharacterized protein LOC129741012 n=1 Tax=Uranotaenia lowii TaxID=190385 RepID=UPI002478B04E|nr:uncharacterized protein LOC129741012 [Uranotaenia lowii]
MKSAQELELEIPLHLDVVTSESCSRILQVIIENLLYQRNQIPFAYETFRTLITKMTDQESQDDNETMSWNNYQLIKQRDLAKKSLQNIKDVFTNSTQLIEQVHQILQMKFIFGSTIYTAKEIFTIKMPKIDRNHYPQHHRQRLEAALKILAMQLTLCEKLQANGSRITGPTNAFVMVGMSGEPGSWVSSEDVERTWHLVEDYKSPVNCRKYLIQIKNISTANDSLCCKEMKVFSEQIEQLSLEGSAKNNSFPTDDNNQENGDDAPKDNLVWYQLDGCLKGYKEYVIKGKTIWNS